MNHKEHDMRKIRVIIVNPGEPAIASTTSKHSSTSSEDGWKPAPSRPALSPTATKKADSRTSNPTAPASWNPRDRSQTTRPYSTYRSRPSRVERESRHREAPSVLPGPHSIRIRVTTRDTKKRNGAASPPSQGFSFYRSASPLIIPARGTRQHPRRDGCAIGRVLDDGTR